ncbi:uncharacterized protein LOC129597482 isoform X2 [Paramacrobiotus metropolitanus]|uniref:uncharacterized protein LOC129597482 isoform X2 n=1 Tax=Paramacrobiotus metropolitanus TaxID=2943436 RepID=UPI002445DB69|nr:uncharacterized protein LOC129597482 isoform X2 [Paramacrobiotus metropolitanus]
MSMAKHFSGDCTPPNCLENAAGTVPFVSPEMVSLSAKQPHQRNSVGRKADIWSLGCTLIQMLQQGKPPRFIRADRSHDTVVLTASNHNFQDMYYYFRIGYKPQYPTVDICGHGCKGSCSLLTPEAATFLDKCLEKDPVKRPNCNELLQMNYFARTMANFRSAEMQRYVVKRYEVQSLAQIEDAEETETPGVNSPKNIGNLAVNKAVHDNLNLLQTAVQLPHSTGDCRPYTVTFISTTNSEGGNDELLMASKAAVFEILRMQVTSKHVIKHLAAIPHSLGLRVFTESEGSFRPLDKFITERKFKKSFIPLFTGQILEGLAVLHEHGIIHKDIRCSNILVQTVDAPTARYILKIAHFEKSSREEHNGDRQDYPEGSSHFASTEMQKMRYPGSSAEQTKITTATDVFSLGCTVIEMHKRSPPDWVYRDTVTGTYKNFIFKTDGKFADFVSNLSQLSDFKAEPDVSSIHDNADARNFVEACCASASKRPTCRQLSDHVFIVGFSVGVRCSYSFRTDGCLGKGHFATVRAVEINDGIPVTGKNTAAVKIIQLSYVAPLFDLHGSSPMRQRCETLLELKHPNLATYFQVTVKKNRKQDVICVEVLMDYYSRDLEKFLRQLKKENKILELATGVRYAREITAGLNYLHERTIVHGRLAPAKIFFRYPPNEPPIVVIGGLDCIIFRQNNNSLTEESSFGDTIWYKAPEVIILVKERTGERIGSKSDIWSLGCILMELFTFNIPGYKRQFTNGTQSIPAENDMSDHVYESLILKGYIPKTPDPVPSALQLLVKCIESCLRFALTKRCSANDLLHLLSDVDIPKATEPYSSSIAPRSERELNRGTAALSETVLQLTSTLTAAKFDEGADNVETSSDKYQPVPLTSAQPNFDTEISRSPTIIRETYPHSSEEDLETIRHYIYTILNTAVTVTKEFPPYHGGIFRENVTGVFESDQGYVVLGSCKNIKELWTNWISEGSLNVAYIPPEGIFAMPASVGDPSKVDSWALGCLAIQMINCDRPLTIKRQYRYSQSEYLVNNGDMLQQLKKIYKGAGQAGLAVGPEISLPYPVPRACEEFLSCCLEPDPFRRWSLQDLKKLPFLNLGYSLADLFAMETTQNQQQLPAEGKFTITNAQTHPFMPSDPAMTVQLGDIQWNDGGVYEEKNVDIWRFVLMGKDDEVEKEKRLKIKAFGKLTDALTMERNTDARTKRHADYYGIRALQKGTKNVVHHFGCQFFSHASFPAEFQVFTEHCPGGNLRQAALHYLPLNMIGKWIMEVLEGLKYLHGHGIVHRNLNSNLIFFSEKPFQGTLKIGGFHLMRQVELEGNASVQHGISVRQGEDGRFLPPEMVDDQKAYNLHTGRKCDTWSLGCVALHLASGQPPLYKGDKDKPIELEMAVLYYLNTMKKPPEIPDWIPSHLRSFILSCLQFDPVKRPYAAELDTSKLLCTDIDDSPYCASRGGAPLPEGVAEYWKQVNAR